MRYTPFGFKNPWVWNEEVKLLEKDATPCWSLAALYSILTNNADISTTLYHDGRDGLGLKWFCEYDSRYKDVFDTYISGIYADNPIDACYEMIIKIHKSKLDKILNDETKKKKKGV